MYLIMCGIIPREVIIVAKISLVIISIDYNNFLYHRAFGVGKNLLKVFRKFFEGFKYVKSNILETLLTNWKLIILSSKIRTILLQEPN